MTTTTIEKMLELGIDHLGTTYDNKTRDVMYAKAVGPPEIIVFTYGNQSERVEALEDALNMVRTNLANLDPDYASALARSNQTIASRIYNQFQPDAYVLNGTIDLAAARNKLLGYEEKGNFTGAVQFYKLDE